MQTKRIGGKTYHFQQGRWVIEEKTKSKKKDDDPYSCTCDDKPSVPPPNTPLTTSYTGPVAGGSILGKIQPPRHLRVKRENIKLVL